MKKMLVAHPMYIRIRAWYRKVGIELHGRGNSNFHGARPVY